MAITGCATAPPPMTPDTSPTIVGEDGVVSAKSAENVVEKLARRAPDASAFTDLLNTIGSLSDSPVYIDSRAKLLIDGPATYAAMLEEIKKAQQFIHVETYIFSDDKVGQVFADALIHKSREGIDVRLIFDSVGSFASDDAIFEKMRDAGIEVFEFSKLNPLDGGNPLDVNVRDHRKLLIVDGRVGFTGGINFSKTYSSRPGQQRGTDQLADGWRDTHIAVYGPAVAAMEKVFQKNWQLNEDNTEQLVVELPAADKVGNDLLVVLDAKGGNDRESPIYHAYLEAIALAQERVWITQAYFVPDKALNSALAAAVERGIDVRILVPGMSDSGLVQNASQSHYADLLRRGVRIYETTTSMLHAKTAVVDGLWSTVGSSNLDSRSTLHNDEINVVVFGEDFASQMERLFERDLENCTEVLLAAWENRSVMQRLSEYFSRWFAYWL